MEMQSLYSPKFKSPKVNNYFSGTLVDWPLVKHGDTPQNPGSGNCVCVLCTSDGHGCKQVHGKANN